MDGGTDKKGPYPEETIKQEGCYEMFCCLWVVLLMAVPIPLTSGNHQSWIFNKMYVPKTTSYKYGPLLFSVRLKIQLGGIFKEPRASEVPGFMFSTR